MKSFAALLASAAIVAGCASAPAPAPAPVNPSAPPIQATTLTDAPTNWQMLDESVDRMAGISVERAYRELLAGKSPKRAVVVAIIDGGLDTTHPAIRANLWKNPRAGGATNGDNYPGDARGWDFIGGRGGKDVQWDTYEVTRQYARCSGGKAADGEPAMTPAERSHCDAIKADFEKQRAQSMAMQGQMTQIRAVVAQIVPMLRSATKADSLTPENVRALNSGEPNLQRARQVFLSLADAGITPYNLDDAAKQVGGDEKHLDPNYNPRSIVGDHYADLTERYYGNGDVMGPDALHATHVAGIIGAVRTPGATIQGIAPAVQLMSVRAVPDGDERDKDIGNAIRFAVDHGAQIINMSFGKGYSPYKQAVDDAVKYADSHGVLMIHAAGNDGENMAEHPSFPVPTYLDGGRATNWIEVGASSWKGGENLAANFSNYGMDQVDVFAPGVDILSSLPGGKYGRESGTSMASPVVSGLAALIMDYYPSLSASDVKRIILASATRHPDQVVIKPGSNDKVTFGTLSRTGGIVNAYAALKMAGGQSP